MSDTKPKVYRMVTLALLDEEDEQMIAALDRLAKDSDRSRMAMIRVAIKRLIAESHAELVPERA